MLRAAGAAGGDEGNPAGGAHRGELLEIVALAHAIRAHAVENDLARPALLYFAHPRRHVSARCHARTTRIATESPCMVTGGGFLAVDPDDHALRAKRWLEGIDQAGLCERRGVYRDLVGPRVEYLLGIERRADSTGDAERDVQRPGNAAHPAPVDRAAFGTGGDVVEDELVRAFVAVARGERQDVADALVRRGSARPLRLRRRERRGRE